MDKLKPIQLRRSSPLPQAVSQIKRQDIFFIVEDVLDTFNIGGIFRLADAVAATKVYLCGQTPIPPDTKIKKSSVNTWQWVPWEYHKTAVEAIRQLKKEVPAVRVVAIEQDDESIDYQTYNYTLPLALVVGNETSGINKSTLQIVDQTVEIPMRGINTSLNVIVSLSVVSFESLKNNYGDIRLDNIEHKK